MARSASRAPRRSTSTPHAGMDFNRELRRVGYGYRVDRKLLRLE